MRARPLSQRRWSAVLTALLIPPLLFVSGAANAAPAFVPPAVQRIKPVDVRDVPASKPVTRKSDQDTVTTPASATMPKPGKAEIDLTGTAKLGAVAPARAGDLPVSIGPAASTGASLGGGNVGKVKVELLDQTASRNAGQTGVMIRLSRADGSTEPARVAMRLDYSGFTHANGGDWGNRLRLVQLPECALTTPSLAQCQPVALTSRNDAKARTLSADVPLKQGMLFAATAAPSSSAGTYKASDLSPSATWQAGSSTGGFTWSYPMGVPLVPGGLMPTLGLSYSSSSVDGKTVSTNSQPSWAGEGFSFGQSYIERRYKACADDMGVGANNTIKTGDQCWETDNATMSLNGGGGELLKGTGGLWHPRSDDGSRIERLTGASNGDNDGEYWKVTATNGDQYFFGRNTAAGSTWTVPVAGNETGEPCRATTFAASFCTQAWRWNLDYVLDRDGNVMTYFYGQEKNRYAKNADGTNTVEYVRSGWLDRIEYGLRASTETTVPASARVMFAAGDRCSTTTGCDPVNNRANFPDTPLDQTCASTTSCTQFAPTFWTGKRLAAISTQVRNGSGYRNVDSWTLKHTFRDPQDTTSAVLWLDRVVRTGYATDGSSIAMEPVRFDGVAMNNRADGLEGTPPMKRFRVTNIFNETGGETLVTYSGQECIPGVAMPAGQDNNTLRCMPVRWQPEGYASPIVDWFNIYTTLAVSGVDHTGGATRTVTRYEYLGNPAWHGDDDDGLVDANKKSWAQFRGYAEVKVHVGDPGEEEVSSTRYFRGMHGDKLANGTARVVKVDGIDDLDAYAGLARESITYNGAAKVSGTVSDPWRSGPTATRTINGSTVESRFYGSGKVRTEVVLDNNRPSRFTSVTNRHDAYGMVDQTADQGDESILGDERCTTTTFARNTTDWLMSHPSTVEIYAKPCGTAPATEHDVISYGRFFYDSAASHLTPPSRGNVTRNEIIASWSATGTHTWTSTTRDVFDQYGRVTKMTDAMNNAITTVYTHDAAGLLTGTTTTNALFHSATIQVDTGRGLPLAETDVNGKRTDLVYDALGRMTGVWRPGRTIGADTPNYAFEYHLRKDAPSATVTKILNPAGAQVSSYEIFDGLLRRRQLQNPSPSGGRVLSDTFYDTAGRSVLGYEKYYATGAPNTTLVTAVNSAQIEHQTAVRYDGAGRVVASVFRPKNVEKWKSVTSYGGDRTYVLPPVGGTARTAVLDARGKLVELRQHHALDPYVPGDPAASTYDKTSYSYDVQGDLRSVTDPLGNHWDYTLDLRGRVISAVDPDRGASAATYDDLDRQISADSGGVKLVTTYDKLGRKTGLYEGSTSGAKRATWSYDTAINGKGRLASLTSYIGTAAYSTAITSYSETGQALSSRVSIPSTEGALAGSYDFNATFNVDGSVDTRTYPELAGDLSETVQYRYDGIGNPITMSGDLPDTPTYVTGTTYSEYNDLLQVKLSTGNGLVYRAFTYETDTGRLATSTTLRDRLSPNTVASATYQYDAAGNVLSAADSVTGDKQCYRQDYLRRTVASWTPATAACTTDPSTSNLGGPAPYWHSYTFDVLGNRRTETKHATAGDTTSTYTYGSSSPHALTKVDTTAPGAAPRTDTFGYNTVGETTSRTVAGIGQTLTWDPEGRIVKVVEGAKVSTYVYDADGKRIITRDSTGTTLTLPYGAELHVDLAGGNKTCTRYYSYGSMTVAVRKGTQVTWLAADMHDTGEAAISDGSQTITRRYSLPFGGSRGATPASWPTNKGFVGGKVETTGLTHLGAREYDPALGRFLSVDPIIDNGDPQQMNGYAYSNNNPATFSDPNGLLWGWVKAAVNVVTNPVKSIKAVANFVYENAGSLSAAAGILALIPPLGVVMGPIALGLGALDAIKSCKNGDAIDCAVGVAGCLPGGRLLATAAKGKRAAAAALKAEKTAASLERNTAGINKARPRKSRSLGSASDQSGRVNRATEAADDAAEAQAKSKSLDVAREEWEIFDLFPLSENVLFENCKNTKVCGDSRQETLGLPPVQMPWNKPAAVMSRISRPMSPQMAHMYQRKHDIMDGISTAVSRSCR